MPATDPLSSLSAAIRAQLQAARTAAAAQGLRGQQQAPAQPRKPAGASGTAAGEAGLLARVRASASLAPDLLERRRAAFRLFLEDALSREFGPALRTDAEFARLVEQVHGRMEDDAALREAMLAAGDLLLQRARTER